MEQLIPLKKAEIPTTDFQAGVMLLVDKPKDWTSFDVVNKVRWALRKRLNVKKIKVGHSGTLDPMATGLLILCIGKFTKKLSLLEGLPKSYNGTMKFGETTPSYDAESEVDGTFPIHHISKEFLLEKTEQFKGWIDQTPPMFSAIKVKGQPLYKLARKGIKIEIKSRKVEITKYDLPRIEMPEVDFEIDCSKGTYIRSLAYDLGKAADCGAHLIALRRTSIGDYSIDDAFDLKELVGLIHPEGVERAQRDSEKRG